MMPRSRPFGGRSTDQEPQDEQEKLLPQNIEAETAVLGSILIVPEAIVEVANYLRPRDFYRNAHETIYQAAGLFRQTCVAGVT